MDAVTVTANSAAHLRRLVSCAPLMASFERLIVVDTGSADDSLDVAAAAGAEVVVLDAGTGYGAAVNAGARLARGPLLAVLNPDVRFPNDRVVPLLAAHFDDPRVAIVAPALELPDGRIQDSARRVPTPLDLVLRRGPRPERGAIGEGGDVPWVVGALFLVRRGAWAAVGGFDERYFLYFEDVDFCTRIRESGWAVRYDPSVRAFHDFQAASRRSVLAACRHARSALRFFLTHPRYLLPARSR